MSCGSHTPSPPGLDLLLHMIISHDNINNQSHPKIHLCLTMDAKVSNLNTTFLHGIVTSQKLTKPFSQTQTLTLSTKDHFMLMPKVITQSQIQTKPKSLRFTICFYELII